MGDSGIPGNINKGLGYRAMDSVLNYQEDGQYVRRAAIREALANPSNKYLDLLGPVFDVPDAVIQYLALHWYNPDIHAPEL